MKNRILALLIAIAGLPPLAHATTLPASVQYNADDLMMGFHAPGNGTGANTCYVVDIGQPDIYKNAAPGSTIVVGNVRNLGNIGQDLADNYGAQWYTRSDLLWSISGTPGSSAAGSDTGADGAKLMYATIAEPSPGVHPGGWVGGNSSSQGKAVGEMVLMEQQYVRPSGASMATVNLSTVNSPVAIRVF